MRFETALDVFTRSFARVRDATRPAQALRHGPLWIVRDTPPHDGNPRLEEIFAYGCSVDEALAAVREYTPNYRFAIGLFETPGQPGDAIKSAMKSHGYRLWFTEGFFTCALADRPTAPAPPALLTLRRARTRAEAFAAASAVAKPATHYLRAADELAARPSMRMYFAEIDGRPVASVYSVHLRKSHTYVQALHTHKDFRRRGIATALMHHLLDADAAHGATHSVLMASHSGARLYPSLGYQRIGTLLFFRRA